MPNDSLVLGVVTLAVVDCEFIGPSVLLGGVAALFSWAYRRRDMYCYRIEESLEYKQLAHVTGIGCQTRPGTCPYTCWLNNENGKNS